MTPTCTPLHPCGRTGCEWCVANGLTAGHANGDEPDPPPHPADSPGTRSERSFVRNDTPNRTNERSERPTGAVWVRGGTLMATKHPALRWHLHPLIAEGLTVFAGAPKVGKSWFLQSVALAVASGGTVLGVRVEQRPVLHLALEDSTRRLQARANVLGYHDTSDVLDDWHVVTRLGAGESVPDLVARWTAQLPLEASSPLVLLDTWGRAKGPRPASLSPYDHDYAVGVALKDAADGTDGGALVAAHHDRKADSADFVDSLSGTHGIGGSADTVVVVRRDRIQSFGVVLVTGRDVEEASYAVTFDAGRWTLTGDDWDTARAAASQAAAAANRGPVAQQVVQLLATNGPSTPAALADEIGELVDAVRMALSRMLEAGHVVRVKRGVYALPDATLPIDDPSTDTDP